MSRPEPLTRDSGHQCDATILIAEDDTNMRELIADVLGDMGDGAQVVKADSANDALDYLEHNEVAVVVTDLRMPGADGGEVLRFAKAHNSMTQVVLVTGYATVESAIDTLKAGAFDYLRKPFENIELRCTVMRALDHYRLSCENRRLREEKGRGGAQDNLFVGQSNAIMKVQRMIAATAGYDCGVLLNGESGSGKEVVARQIHRESGRRGGPFVAINCAAIPENLIESELFGFRKGAFTGAERTKAGLFEVADGGTIFLDEINNASLSLQAKLLRVLQDGTYYPMGDTDPKHVNVRVVAATNRTLREMIEENEFREDLYYRLAVVEIEVPPLRQRPEDVPLLAYYFLNRFSKEMDKPIDGITTQALEVLMRYEWPGNVRELENIVQRMIILAEDKKLDVDALPGYLTADNVDKPRALDRLPPQSLEDIEAFFIKKTLRENKGDRTMSAQILGIDKSTLWRKMKRYGIKEAEIAGN